MKKTVLFILTLLFCLLPMNAQQFKSKCYRGSVDAGYSIGVGDYEFNRFEINTSQGYQFNPYLFLGAGTGVHFMSSYDQRISGIIFDQRDSKVDIPIFANFRYNILNKKFSPFIDLKGGTFVTNNGELYLSISAGCRYTINQNYAINLSVGYSNEKLEFTSFDRFTSNMNMNYKTKTRMLETECISIKLGLEF